MRPRLAAAADTNDWRAYFDHGAAIVKLRPREAETAFYWAARLDPERAEPLFARWVAWHLTDYDRWESYVFNRKGARHLPEIEAMDSVRLRAMVRNPYVPQNLEILLYDWMPGDFRTDDMTRGWIEYSNGRFQRAAVLLGRGIRREPERFVIARQLRASAFVMLAQYDSALAEMQAMRTTLARRDSAAITSYESKELVEYAIGFLEAARGDSAAANEAMRRALTENLGFTAAHLFLGDQALRANDAPRAASEYEAAWQVDSSDAVLAYHYALALGRLRRAGDAALKLLRAIALEPYYARPYAQLGRVFEALHDVPGARAAYAAYLARARRDDEERRDVSARLAALGPG